MGNAVLNTNKAMVLKESMINEHLIDLNNKLQVFQAERKVFARSKFTLSEESIACLNTLKSVKDN